MRQQNIDIVQEDNLIVDLLLYEQLGVQLDMVLFITLNLQKPTSPILQVWKL